MRLRAAGLGILCSLLVGCRVHGGDASELGYGDGAAREHGYSGSGSPFERPKPAAWSVDEQPQLMIAIAPDGGGPPPIPPSPDVVGSCEHIVPILARESGGDPARLGPRCHADQRAQKLGRTADAWQAYMTCNLAATDGPALALCRQAHPALVVAGIPDSRERDACQHLIMTTLFEELGSDANLAQADLEGFRPIVEECVESLSTEERKRMSPEAYSAMIDCILAEDDTTAMEACN